MASSVAIIGAGIAGLSAGCYAQMNGFDTRIFEMHDKPGGVCTAWQRKGYTIDGCLHYLVGSAPGHDFYRFWQELGALQGREVINMDQLYRFEDAQGRVFNMFCDIERLQDEMLRLSPADAGYIKTLCRALRQFTKFNMVQEKPPELSGIADNLKNLVKILPVLGAFGRWSKLTLADVASHLKDPLLKTAWGCWHDEMSAMAFMTNLAWFNNRTAGYLIGGSLPLARNIENRFRELGGKVGHNTKVTGIIVENNRAVGLRLNSGEELRADYVISASDGRSTIDQLLDGKYIDESLRTKFETAPKYPPILYIGLGVKRKYDEIPQMIEGLVPVLDSPVRLCGKEVGYFTAHFCNFDATLAPSGKTAVILTLDTDYDFWKSLRTDVGRYKEEKMKTAETLVSILDKRLPGFTSQVEMTDVATPLTFERYTGNWKGHYQAFVPTPRILTKNAAKTLPGLSRFYLAGQWVSFGGLPTAASAGRQVVQLLCQADGKKFTTIS